MRIRIDHCKNYGQGFHPKEKKKEPMIIESFITVELHKTDFMCPLSEQLRMQLLVFIRDTFANCDLIVCISPFKNRLMMDFYINKLD